MFAYISQVKVQKESRIMYYFSSLTFKGVFKFFYIDIFYEGRL
jgi:hypothetical protein